MRTSVLIVEDEGIVAADLAGRLRLLGYEVSGTAARGLEAIELTRERRPDVVLMDIHLSGPMDGIAAAERIRAEHDVPVVYLTAHSDPATMERARLTEPFGYVLKPFEDRELQTNIEMARYRHRLDRQLRESREDLNRAQAMSHTGSWRLSIPMNELAWSDEAWQIFGVPKNTPLNYDTFLQCVHPDDRARVDAQWSAALRGEPYDIEHRIVADGAVKWVHQNAQLEFDSHGALRGALGTVHDVTELRTAQQALREAYARAEWLARFPEENPNPVLRVGDNGAVLYANPAARNQPGWTSVEGGRLAPMLRPLLERAIAEHVSVEMDVELADKIYAVAAVRFPQESYCNLYGRDVTERRRVERAVLHAKEEWERTFDSVPDLISILDTDHHIVRVNRAMANRLGKTPEQCVGLACYEVVHGCQGPIKGCPHQQTLSDGREHSADVHEDGLGGDFLVTTTPLHDLDGRRIGAVHVARDITESKRREVLLERLNRALSALSRSSHALLQSANETEFLREACRIVVEDCGYAMVWIGYAEDDEAKTIRPVAQAGFEKDYFDQFKLTWADTERGRGPTGTAIRTKQVCRCDNMLTDPALRPWREAAERYGNTSALALPMVADGKAFGALSIYDRQPRGFSEEEANLLMDLANDFALGIASFRAREARALAEQKVRESEERYRTLFNTMHEGFAVHELLCDREGKPVDYRFLDVNPAYERLVGLTRADLVGKTLREVLPDSEPVWLERFGRVALTGEPEHFDQLHAGLGRHYEVAAYRTAPGAFAVIVNDVTDLKAMQQREKEDAIRLAWGQSAMDTIAAMCEGVVLMELDGTITNVNPAAEKLLGLRGEEMVGHSVQSLLPGFLNEEDLKSALEGLAILFQGEVPQFPPLVINRTDGQAIHVLPRVSLMEAPENGRRVAVVTLMDISDQHEAALRLRELTEKLAATEEEERWRISRYIHDTIIQNLSLSSIRLGAMAKPMAATNRAEDAAKLSQIRGLIDQAADECRMVMSDLTPSLLYELGLLPALHDLAHQVEDKYGARMHVEGDGQERPLSHSLRGLLFQAIRELVMNAIKYAGPCTISVAVNEREEGLILRVADNGQGFDPSVPEARRDCKGGFGLFNIRQRLRGLGGWLEIDSAPGKGTIATIRVPIDGSPSS